MISRRCSARPSRTRIFSLSGMAVNKRSPSPDRARASARLSSTARHWMTMPVSRARNGARWSSRPLACICKEHMPCNTVRDGRGAWSTTARDGSASSSGASVAGASGKLSSGRLSSSVELIEEISAARAENEDEANGPNVSDTRRQHSDIKRSTAILRG